MSNMLIYTRVGTSVATSTDFPIFASDGVFVVIGDGVSRDKLLNSRSFSASATTKTFSMLRIGHFDTQLVPVCGWIKSLVYYPIRLTAAEIKTLST